ncbi:hypothetical protein AgCh_015914 [Apium graveolens]
MSVQLTEVHNSIELILSQLLGDDAKKGEKIIKSKYKLLILTHTDDENPDGGNKGGQKDSKRRKGEELVGVSGLSKVITRFQSRQGGESKRNERRVEDLTMNTKMPNSSQVITIADEDQGCTLRSRMTKKRFNMVTWMGPLEDLKKMEIIFTNLFGAGAPYRGTRMHLTFGVNHSYTCVHGLEKQLVAEVILGQGDALSVKSRSRGRALDLCGWASSADIFKASRRRFPVGFSLGLGTRDLSPLGFQFGGEFIVLFPVMEDPLFSSYQRLNYDLLPLEVDSKEFSMAALGDMVELLDAKCDADKLPD